MNYSLNEFESTAKRATRGACYPWGLAEEAGKAARWLAHQGIDCSCDLLRLLNERFSLDFSGHTPRCNFSPWQSDGLLCALISGAALADRAEKLKSEPIVLERVFSPIFLIPFAAIVADQLQGSITVDMDGWVAMTDGSRLQFDGKSRPVEERVQISLGGKIENARALQSRANPNKECWQGLLEHAHKTYAPATEQSRRLGAGAGLSDND